MPGPHLFDAVRVNSSLRLKYADWFRFLGALRHLPNFLGDKVVDAIKGFDGTLYQADAFCCSCEGRKKDPHLYEGLLTGNAAKESLDY